MASPPLRCAHRPVLVPTTLTEGDHTLMITLGIDAHKRTNTVVAVDELGRKLGTKTTTSTTSDDHLDLVVRWADRCGPERQRAVEDCRHLSRRLESDMLAAGERIVRAPPTLMAHARDAARTYGQSDPIDARAVAHAALRNPDLAKDAYARHNGTAPLPVWSGNREGSRLSRTGNRQLNAAIHRIAVTQMRCHDDAINFLERRDNQDHTTKADALRALKRRLSDVVYRALAADARRANTAPADLLAAAA